MNLTRSFSFAGLFALGGLLVGMSPWAAAVAKTAGPEAGQISIYVGQLLEKGHLTRHPLDDGISARLLDSYLQYLDYSRIFFTQEDVDRLKKEFGTELDDYVLLGNPKPVLDIYTLYKKRVAERVAFAKAVLSGDFDFKSDRTVELNRQKAPWPKDTADAEAIWKVRIEGELLQARLNEHADKPPKELLTNRYEKVLRNVDEMDNNEVVYDFVSALARVYDPHSEYLDPDELEDFRIGMRLSLVGIGAVLRSDEGYVRIVELVPGGPAELSGRLSVNDRIASVAQGSGEFTDVFDMRINDVVKLIRGEKGTIVRLQTIPASATDPSERKVVEIKRDKVELKNQEAKAEIIERAGPGGQSQRLGWLTVPSFYADMSPARPRDAKSTTKDVAVLLERLKKEKISGLVVDLRRNGGGSLEEAVSLTGLFIDKGPVVQTKDTGGTITVSRDRDPRMAYDGPLVVLTSRMSASASEIFAAALQDYNRAVIVGDSSTFGKGTVQTMLDLARFMTPAGGDTDEAGALKLTIQQFYRVNGGSTQLRGVISDIHLPTLTDQPDFGEAALDGPLPYDEIPSLKVDKFADQPLSLDELRRRSQARVTASREFRYVIEDAARLSERIAQNRLSVNEEVRRKELADNKARIAQRKEERLAEKRPEPIIYAVTLDNVSNPALQLAANEKPAKPEAAPQDRSDADPLGAEDEVDGYDAEREEALNILSDLVTLSIPPRTASVGGGPA